MNNHFLQHLNVSELIRENKPVFIVELGAHSGENTHNLLWFRTQVTPRYRVVTIDDNADRTHRCEHCSDETDFVWRQGISWEELAHFSRNSIDFAIVDTDHNYYTLDRELRELERTVRGGGVVCLHDTLTFRTSNGYAGRYGCCDYRVEVKEGPPYYYDAMLDAIARGTYELIREVKDSCGAAALRRV